MAVDGDRRAQLLLGVPVMMEYDGPTGAWKLVVDTELDTVIMVSGTVSIEAGDIEIGAVELKDAVTDDRQRVTADGRAWVSALITGTVDTELPAALLLADDMANPTAPQVAAHLMGYDGAGGDWERARMDGPSLLVSLVSGSFPDGETLPVSLASLPNLVVTEDEVTAYVTGSVGLVFAPTIQREIIDISGSAAAEYMLATGVAGQQIKLLEVMLISSNLQNVRFLSGWSGSFLTGPLHLANSGDGFFVGTPDGKDVYHFETVSGQMLVLDTDAGGQIGGWLNYYTE